MKAKVMIAASLMCVSAWAYVADVTKCGAKGDGATKDTNGEWVCGYPVPRCGNAAVLVPHSVGRLQHPDWASLKPGETYIRCDPGWGMTYRMVALLNETGDSYAIVQKGAREYASFLRVRTGTDPATVLYETDDYQKRPQGGA